MQGGGPKALRRTALVHAWRLLLWGVCFASLVACAPTAGRPIYSEAEVSREINVQKSLANGSLPAFPQTPVADGSAPAPTGDRFQNPAASAPDTAQSITVPAPPSFRSRQERLKYVGTRVSIAAAPFCRDHLTSVPLGDRTVRACAYPWKVVPKQDQNAYADGRRIVIYSGLMDLAASDEELALAFGHELAHNVMEHRKKKTANAIIGAVIGAAVSQTIGVDVTGVGAVAGSQVFSQSFEAEADYVGVYFAALAGYDYRAAAGVWRKMGAEHPKTISHGSSHPATAERYVALAAASREIDEKLAHGEPLVPNGLAANGPVVLLAVAPGIPGTRTALRPDVTPALFAGVPQTGNSLIVPTLTRPASSCSSVRLSFGFPGRYVCQSEAGSEVLVGSFGRALDYYIAVRRSGPVVPAVTPTERIREFDENTKAVSGTPPVRIVGGAAVVDFSAAGRQCAGFYKRETTPAPQDLTGYFCAASKSFTDDEIQMMLARISVVRT